MSQRRIPYMILNNYKFIKHRSSQRSTYWKCQLYDGGFCKARCTTHVDQTIKLTSEHCHDPSIDNVNALAVISKEVYTVVKVSVLSSLNGLQYTTYQILSIVKEILKSNSDISVENLTIPENLPNFPLKTYQEYISFDSLIKRDTVINQYMVKRLAALGGSGIDSITRRIMKFLFDNELATRFNWKGRHNKTGFEATATMNIVYEAAKLNFPPSEKSDLRIAENVKQWLKHANSRLKQTKGKITDH